MVQIDPIVAFDLVAVLVNRLVYVGYLPSNDAGGDAGAQSELVVIDTTDPSNPALYDRVTLPAGAPPIGLIGSRSCYTCHDNGACGCNGGTVDLVLSTPCATEAGADGLGDAGVCSLPYPPQCLSLQPFTIPASGPIGSNNTAMPAGAYRGQATFGSFLTGGPVDIIGETLCTPNFSLNGFNPINITPVGTTILQQTNELFFKPLAFAECLGQALLVGTNQDLNVYSIPLLGDGGGELARVTLTHSGQGIYFEPFTSTVLAPFSQGEGYQLTALTLGGTQSNPTLTQRSNWNPPADVRPEVVATRVPLPITCGDAGL